MICVVTALAVPAVAQEPPPSIAQQVALTAPELYIQTLRGTVWIVNATDEGTFLALAGSLTNSDGS